MADKPINANAGMNTGMNLGNQIKASIGQMSIEDQKQTVKTPVMSFNALNVYVGFKLVEVYDPKTDKHREAVPKINIGFANKDYFDLPLDGRWWKDFAAFTKQVADSMDGVNYYSANIKADDNAKGMLSKFREHQ